MAGATKPDQTQKWNTPPNNNNSSNNNNNNNNRTNLVSVPDFGVSGYSIAKCKKDLYGGLVNLARLILRIMITVSKLQFFFKRRCFPILGISPCNILLACNTAVYFVQVVQYFGEHAIYYLTVFDSEFYKLLNKKKEARRDTWCVTSEVEYFDCSKKQPVNQVPSTELTVIYSNLWLP